MANKKVKLAGSINLKSGNIGNLSATSGAVIRTTLPDGTPINMSGGSVNLAPKPPKRKY